ncbi:MAG: hypothetical protein JXB39_08945 [Deltaproteobacteria bacterium]|nr:hypothetical protein [Deltaproteobacteria bacterium]
MLPLLLLVGCSGTPVCPPCASDQPGAVVLAPWEAALLAGTLEDLRAGVRITGERGFGICSGRTECESFVGPTSQGPLPEGHWFVRAEFEVPSVGEGWTVLFHVTCTTNPGSPNASTQVHDRAYPVKYTGREGTYRLQPLWKIQSPYVNGPRSCTFSLTPVRPDGVRGEPWTGAYETAGPTASLQP